MCVLIFFRAFLSFVANEKTRNTPTHILVIPLIKLSTWFDMKYAFKFWINQWMNVLWNVLWNVTLYLWLSGSRPFESLYCLQLERSSRSRINHFKLSKTPTKRHTVTSLKMYILRHPAVNTQNLAILTCFSTLLCLMCK